MPKKPIAIPKFRTTEEEAIWWESREGKRIATDLMKRAVDAGTARRRKVPLKNVTMRLPEPDIEALVASPETAARLGLANKLRAEKGYPPLSLVTVDWVNAEDGRPLSSTRIRSGEVDEKGHVAWRSSP